LINFFDFLKVFIYLVFEFIHKFLIARIFHQAPQSYLFYVSNTQSQQLTSLVSPQPLQLYCTPIPASTLRPHPPCITTITFGLPRTQSSHHTRPHIREITCLPTWLLFLDCLTLKMKAVRFFEMLGNAQRHSVESSVMPLIFGCFVLRMDVL
jgi:hypothetical protein